MLGVVLAALDFDGEAFALVFNDEIEFAEFFAVEIIAVVTMGVRFLCHRIFENGTAVHISKSLGRILLMTAAALFVACGDDSSSSGYQQWNKLNPAKGVYDWTPPFVYEMGAKKIQIDLRGMEYHA